MHIVYILQSVKDNQFYTGYTTNLRRRLAAHKCGDVDSTRYRRPLHCIYYEVFINKYDAIRRESYFKSTAGKKTLRLMLRETLKPTS